MYLWDNNILIIRRVICTECPLDLQLTGDTSKALMKVSNNYSETNRKIFNTQEKTKVGRSCKSSMEWYLSHFATNIKNLRGLSTLALRSVKNQTIYTSKQDGNAWC